MNQIKRKIKKKSSPQQALKSKRSVVVTSCRQSEDLTYTGRLGDQTALELAHKMRDDKGDT